MIIGLSNMEHMFQYNILWWNILIKNNIPYGDVTFIIDPWISTFRQ